MPLATFVRDYQVILTRRCAYSCGYCAFGSTPSPVPPSKKQLIRHLRAAGRLGARQVTLTAGEGIEANAEIMSASRYFGFEGWYEYIAAVCQQVLSSPAGLYPVLDAGAIPLTELRKLKPYLPVMRLLMHSADDKLLRTGIHSGAPHKSFAARHMALEATGKLGISTITGITIGMGETPESWTRAALTVSSLYRAHGHIVCFAIRPFFPDRFSPMEMWPPVADDVLLDAVKRVRDVLAPEILLSVELAARPHLMAEAVKAGAEDLGPFRLGDGSSVNFDIEDQIDGARETAAKAGIAFEERMPFIDHYLGSREGREQAGVTLKEYQRLDRRLKAPPSTAIA